jgi:hypothetical protein
VEAGPLYRRPARRPAQTRATLTDPGDTESQCRECQFLSTLPQPP